MIRPRSSHFAAPFLLGMMVLLALASCAGRPGRRDFASEYYNLGNAYAEIGRLDEAETFLRRSLELVPDDPSARYNLALVLLQRGDAAAAMVELDWLLIRDPLNGPVREALAYALTLDGRTGEALAVYDDLLEEQPGHRRALLNSARLLARDGRNDEAVRRLTRLRELSPDDREVTRELAALHVADGRTELAADLYEEWLGSGEYIREGAEEARDVYRDGEYWVRYRSVAELLAVNEGRGEDWFLLGEAEILYLSEPDSGIVHIGQALAAGFADWSRYEALEAAAPAAVREELSALMVRFTREG